MSGGKGPRRKGSGVEREIVARHRARGRLSANAGRAPLVERGDDLYETPVEATLALLRAEKLPRRIWEPACGRGAIVNVLRAAGHEVVASDLVDYGVPITAPGYWRNDFLMERQAPEGTEAIVTNPPFKLVEQFIEHALELCPLVVMLLRLAFLEGKKQRRCRILDSGALARVHVFRSRLPRMHRDGWSGPRAESSIPFAWFVFNREHTGTAEIRRLSWEPLRAAEAER
jgi:hypothetical protein